MHQDKIQKKMEKTKEVYYESMTIGDLIVNEWISIKIRKNLLI